MKDEKEIGEKVVAIMSGRLPKGSFSAFNEMLLVNSFVSFGLERLGLLAVKMAEKPEENKEMAFWSLMEFILGLAEDQAAACNRLVTLLEPTVRKNIEFEKIVEEAKKPSSNSKLVH